MATLATPPLRAYGGVLRARLKSVSHFRANLLAWLLYSPLQLGILYLLWAIVYRNTDDVGGYGFDEMILYYLVVHLLRKVIEPVQSINYEVWQEINEGKLDVYLARPIAFAPWVFFRSLATPAVEAAVGIPLFLVFSLLLGLPLQRDPAMLAAFLLSAMAGYLILFLVQFLIGILTFWMERIFGIRDMIFSVFMLFSGQLIPISALPEWVVVVSRFLPFEGIYYIPATIYTASQLDSAVLAHLLQQGVWIGVLSLLAAAVWTRGVARYASQGG